MRISFLLLALSILALFVLPSCHSVSPEKEIIGTEMAKQPAKSAVPTEGRDDTTKPRALTTAQREKLEAAELARTKWMRFLRNSQSVNDTIQAKEELDRIHEEIAAIYNGEDLSRKKDEGGGEYEFKDTSERKIVYGPLGVVLKLTEWILEKLYIWRSI